MSGAVKICDDVLIPVDDLIGKCIAVLGIRGSGKTNTAAAVIEDLLACGYPMAVVDIDGEYWGLKELYEVPVVGDSAHVDVRARPEEGAAVARASVSMKVPVILDVSGYLKDDINSFLYGFFTGLWEELGKLRTPYQVVLEEAHEFIPQGFKTDLKEILVRAALRGRKRGLGMLVVSQRSAKVEKDVLTQAEVLILHKVVHPSDLKVYKDIIPKDPGDVEELVLSLNVGDAFFLFRDVCKRIHVRERKSFHAGFTPSFDSTSVPKLKSVGRELIAAIRSSKDKQADEADIVNGMRRQIQKLRLTLAERDRTIQRLEDQLETLGRIKVDVRQPELPRILEIARAMVARVVTSDSPSSGQPEALVQDELHQSVSDSLEDELPPDVAAHLRRIKERLLTLNDVERAILQLLVSRYPSQYTYSQIASWTGYSESTLYKNRPVYLEKLGLIRKERKRDGFHFSSDLDEFVESEFMSYVPRISNDVVLRVRDHLRDWISMGYGEVARNGKEE